LVDGNVEIKRYFSECGMSPACRAYATTPLGVVAGLTA